MNILFILGNGFDKAQGLATSYQEFYDYYQKKESESELETQLKKDIQADYNTWADLEEGLGNYSARFSKAVVFRNVLGILNSRLKEYLITQTAETEQMGLSRSKLLSDFMHPESGLEPKQQSILNSYILGFPADKVVIDCVTFNYTKTIETVLKKYDPYIGNWRNKDLPVYLNSIMHLHGALDELILVGVNDVTQIANESFRDNPELKEEFVKPEINNGCENLKNESFIRLIRNANIIVLFGVSVGITDLNWWQAIGERIDNPHDDLRLIYYPYDVKKDTERFPFRKRRWSNEYIAFLQGRMGIQTPVEELRDNIYVGINKPYLKLI